jgi:hypothetical protein
MNYVQKMENVDFVSPLLPIKDTFFNINPVKTNLVICSSKPRSVAYDLHIKNLQLRFSCREWNYIFQFSKQVSPK